MWPIAANRPCLFRFASAWRTRWRICTQLLLLVSLSLGVQHVWHCVYVCAPHKISHAQSEISMRCGTERCLICFLAVQASLHVRGYACYNSSTLSSFQILSCYGTLVKRRWLYLFKAKCDNEEECEHQSNHIGRGLKNGGPTAAPSHLAWAPIYTLHQAQCTLSKIRCDWADAQSIQKLTTFSRLVLTHICIVFFSLFSRLETHMTPTPTLPTALTNMSLIMQTRQTLQHMHRLHSSATKFHSQLTLRPWSLSLWLALYYWTRLFSNVRLQASRLSCHFLKQSMKVVVTNSWVSNGQLNGCVIGIAMPLLPLSHGHIDRDMWPVKHSQ